jgi:hippurate hydrolase
MLFRNCIRAGFSLLLMTLAASATEQSPLDWFKSHEPQLIETYKWFHQHPEVSFEERQTAERFAESLRSNKFEITENVGGFGVVGILENGEGPTVMLRTDLDALPVTEQTPLEFASTAQTKVAGGGTSGVMHACGHDLHITNVIAVSQYLSENLDQWSGTLMVIGQPAEERGSGARAMLDDGLFQRFPKPDYALALHVDGMTAAGTVQVAGGFILANVDSVDITIQGRGGHGSAPDTTIDPIVQAAELVMSLQTIVSREVKPIEAAVVTVGAINAGTKHNIIPDTCHLQITVRSYKDDVRKQVLAAIKRRANGIAAAYNAEQPEIVVSEGTPALENDENLAAMMTEEFRRVLGESKVEVAEQSMGGEDFSQYGRAGVPILMYRLGSVSPLRLARFEQLGTGPPSLHSATYYPDLDPTLRVGFETMTSAVLRLMGGQ